MNRKEADKKYKWDFSNVFENSSDYKQNLEMFQKKFKKINELKGNLGNKEKFLEYLRMKNETDLLSIRLDHYLNLYNLDQTDTELQELMSLYKKANNEYKEALSFANPEILDLGYEKVISFIKGSDYAYQEYIFKKLFRMKDSFLPYQKQEVINQVSNSREILNGFFDCLSYADRQFLDVEINGKKELINTTFFNTFLASSDPIKDQQNRKLVWEKYYNNVTSKKYSFAKTLEGIITKEYEDARLKNYSSALEKALSEDNIPTAIYRKLLQIGKKNIGILKDYYSIIKDRFGFKDFFISDRHLSLADNFSKVVLVEEGKQMVKGALQMLGEEYNEKLDIAMKDNAIDFYEDSTKRSGAYSTLGNGVEPSILMNWSDTLSSVSTLAHELGHSVHTLFAEASQKYPLCSYPIILAEIASTFNEHVVFDYLYEKTTDKNEKVCLVQNRIYDMLTTFFREIQYADFELQAHELLEKNEPITAERLMNLFKSVELEYGYDLCTNNNERDAYYWPHIAHFFYYPFYVYKYSLDVAASFKIYQDVKKGGSQHITNFLKAGCHKDPLDILKDSGIDFMDEKTYEPILSEIKRLIKLLKELLD
ncbi:oligoendopeptidase F [Spiroplasma helicoides]|uniref:Oligoendopeptidase F n=1 Tax=Spiroplasma helicoides TaxID=216938 RepID=A0A1B3SLW3_9MOLU|nr:M3 family oligoendopeptidase [Spiroplasma helicoides]AOG60913.1 oligoendopeptidase F [Spiroplasma helicoides]